MYLHGKHTTCQIKMLSKLNGETWYIILAKRQKIVGSVFRRKYVDEEHTTPLYFISSNFLIIDKQQGQSSIIPPEASFILKPLFMLKSLYQMVFLANVTYITSFLYISPLMDT